MSVPLPEGRRGQILALVLLFLGLALLWGGLLLPLIDWYDSRADALLEKRAVAEHMVTIAAMVPSLQAEEHGVRPALPDTSSIVLSTPTDAVAGAALQQKIQSVASRSGAAISSIETLTVLQDGGFRRIALRITVAASWPALLHLFASLQSGQPRMLIDDIQIVASSVLSHPNGVPVNATFTVMALRTGTAP